MSALLIGYARCSTDQQTSPPNVMACLGLGVEDDRICGRISPRATRDTWQ
jgi:hypothetical protein